MPSAAAAEPAPPQPRVFALFRNWDPGAQASLEKAATDIDVLVPEWFGLNAADGAIVDKEPSVTKAARADLAQRNPDIVIVPILDNYGVDDWQTDLTRRLLASIDARKRLIDALVQKIKANGFAGIAIDFEGLAPSDQGSYLAFAKSLETAFDAEGLTVFHIVDFAQPTFSPARLADVSDGLITFPSSQTAPNEPPGPLAPQSWFETQAQWWFQQVPVDKLVVGISNLAFDWAEGGGSAETLSDLEAFRRADAYGATPELEPSSLNTRFAYADEAGVRHHVWMTDAVSTYNQLRALNALGARNVMLRRLGTEDPSTLQLLTNPGRPDPDSLSRIDAGYQIQHIGEGEVVSLERLPKNGRRIFGLSDDGTRIVEAKVVEEPNGFEIAYRPAVADNMVALTFDDGPDLEYTTQILDVLRAEGVPATFFFVGSEMLANPDLVKRTVAEGHDVGSHTFNHPNIASISSDMLRLELNATQSVFEAVTGRHMTLFRAPYATDVNPLTPEQLRPMATVSGLGYLSVNMNIDPDDWKISDVDTIVERVMEGAHRGDHVVLLHDGGGNRSATVKALPRIIKRLRAEGYQLVPVSGLLGYTQEQVMPEANARLGTYRRFLDLGYAILRMGGDVLEFVFFAAIGLGILRSLLLIVLSTLRRRRTPDPVMPPPRVGVVVPAHNEEKVILKTVQSLLASDYPNMTILVVDDGSTDGTLALCRTTFANNPRVQVITQQNAGKSVALNRAVAMLDTETIVAIDADTVLAPDAIGKLVAHLSDPEVGAVSGNAKVGNRNTLLTKWQALEYITSQNLDRKAFEFVNGISVVPGAIGAWRRQAVLDVGGYTTDTLAEDADLTIRLLRAGYRVTYEQDAIAYTEAPQSTRQFVKQRFRWMFGMMQAAVKHLGAFRFKDSKSVALFTLPNIIIFQIIFPLFAPIADLAALSILAQGALRLATDSAFLHLDQSLMFLALFGVFLLLDWVTAAIAFVHEKREDKSLLWWVVVQRFYYRQLIYLVAIHATLAAIRGASVGWGKLARSASVVLPHKRAAQE